MAFMFFDEIAVEPIAYVGLGIDSGEIEDSIHTLESTTIRVSVKAVLENSIHDLASGSIRPNISCKLESSIHTHWNYREFNAPVSPVCSRYLQTYFADRLVNTEEEEFYIQTEFEDHYLNNDDDTCT